jgi:hypothetical protein
MATKNLSPQLFDSRVMHRHVQDGSLTADDVKAHLAALPDVASKSEPLRAAQPGQDVEDVEADEENEG